MDLSKKVALLDLTTTQLAEWLASWGEPSFRTAQIRRWIYRSLVTDFAEMSNLPKVLRERLAEMAYLGTMKPLREIVSSDSLARKVLFELRDDQTIESVLMYYNDAFACGAEGRARAKPATERASALRRHTICISTQVGCAVGCPFCATGQGGFVRNLTPGEIVEQVLHFARLLKKEGAKVNNVVFMGMGEPLANYEATWQAIETLNAPDGFGLGARCITVSTVGLVPGIERLSRERLQVGLAVSLHAAEDALRDELVPINKRYPLSELMQACRDYVERTRRRISFEYALIDGINDSLGHARRLARLLRGLLCHVNLIPLNPTAECPYRPSPQKRILAFQAELDRLGIANTLRVARGLDIQAGCGQLRGQRM